jgi:hypothetical protein
MIRLDRWRGEVVATGDPELNLNPYPGDGQGSYDLCDIENLNTRYGWRGMEREREKNIYNLNAL